MFFFLSYLEEVVGELGGDELVPPGQGLAAESQDQPVHGPKVMQVGRVVQLLVQLHKERDFSELLVAAAQAALDQAVTKPLFVEKRTLRKKSVTLNKLDIFFYLNAAAPKALACLLYTSPSPRD